MTLLEHRLAKNLDYVLIASVAGLTLLGLVMIYSATRFNTSLNMGDPYFFVKKQAAAMFIGVVALLFILITDYRYFDRLASPIYLGNILLLLLVLGLGHRISGAQSWFRLGPFLMQPSEFAKIAVITTLASYLSRKQDLSSLRALITPFMHLGLPTILILLQNDLGTALVFLAILAGMLYMAGARPRDLLTIALVGLAVSPLAYFFFLKPYQRSRLLIFLNPYRDPMGDGYNVIQSTIAIGSGRFFGKGLFGGTQAKLNFLPAHHTDFIFSVVGEELGFIGAAIVLLIYCTIVLRTFRAASLAKDAYGRLVAAGVGSMFLFHVLVNVGMTMSIMPVTGIPLPFLSYGGSSLIANLIGMGLVLNVHMRRQKILF